MAAKVFAITELLEHILLDLSSLKDLLFAQRIRKQFKATFDGSIKIQQALFFAPLATTDNTHEPRTNPFLWSTTWTRMSSEHTWKLRKILKGSTNHCVFMTINPNTLPPWASAWRMLLAQSPQHWDVATPFIYARYSAANAALNRGSFSELGIKGDGSRTKSPVLDYSGKTLGTYHYRVSQGRFTDVEGIVWYEDCPGGQILSMWIGRWDQVWWEPRKVEDEPAKAVV